jgi:hypothetical protein
MSANLRAKLGVAALLLGLVMPAGAFFVVRANWPGELKTIVSGILVLGPEIMTVPAVALLGKENFERIVGVIKRALRMLRPSGAVSRTRYTVGLALFVGAGLAAWANGYAIFLLPELAPRVWVNLALDLLFVASLFVLGGDFWDKLRALFVYQARAVFPSPEQ